MEVVQAGGGRVEYIDGLRAVAIAGVLLFHAGIWSFNSGESPTLLGFGHLGVDLFFVVSGFCMVWPMLQRGENTVKPRRFWRRRFLRVALPFWPVLAAAITASWLIYTLGGPSWWNQPQQDIFPATAGLAANVGTHVALVHGFFPQFAHSIDGAFWSLSAEWQFYIVFPVLWWASRRWNPAVVAAAGLAAAALWAAGLKVTRLTVADAVLPWWIGTFCVGMLVAHVARQPSRLRVPWLTAGAIAGLIAFPVEWAKGPEFVGLRPLWAAFFGALVLVSSSGPPERFLSIPVVRRLGLCSYSAYLVHGTVFMLMSIPMSRGAWSQGVRIATYFLVGIPLALVIAWVYYRRVEEPFHRVARGRSREASLPATAAR